MKTRVKFSKCGSMRFIGHLDVMRYFQKAFRRAKIPVTYSQGFSPHPVMSFTSPLGLGLSSDAEYLDVSLDRCENPKDIVAILNQQMNSEIRVLDFTILKDEAKPSMAMLSACDYLVAAKPGYEVPDLSMFIDRFLEQETIEILKKSKRSEKMVNIKEYIYVLTDKREQFDHLTRKHSDDTCLDTDGYRPLYYMQLTAGSIINIKPELVCQALCEYAGVEYNLNAYQIHRMEMYGDLNGKKGEIHTFHSSVPCKLVPLSEYDRDTF